MRIQSSKRPTLALILACTFGLAATIQADSTERVDEQLLSDFQLELLLESNIVELAQGNPDFSILVDAVVAANLVDALSGEGPFTVFAPTNAAFAAALEALGLTAEELLANTELLTQVLLYHVVPGQVLSSQLVNGPIPTLQGAPLLIAINEGVIQIPSGDSSDIAAPSELEIGNGPSIRPAATVNGIDIIGVNILATNGVIHVVNQVILPDPVSVTPPVTLQRLFGNFL